MKKILLIILLALGVTLTAQNTPKKIGNLSKNDFEKWMKSLSLDGYKFAMFDYQSDSYQAMFMKDYSNTFVIIIREDDDSTTDEQIKKMGHTIYERKGLKHYYNGNSMQSIIMVKMPKQKIIFSAGMQGKVSKEKIEKLLDKAKVY